MNFTIDDIVKLEDNKVYILTISDDQTGVKERMNLIMREIEAATKGRNMYIIITNRQMTAKELPREELEAALNALHDDDDETSQKEKKK